MAKLSKITITVEPGTIADISDKNDSRVAEEMLKALNSPRAKSDADYRAFCGCMLITHLNFIQQKAQGIADFLKNNPENPVSSRKRLNGYIKEHAALLRKVKKGLGKDFKRLTTVVKQDGK